MSFFSEKSRILPVLLSMGVIFFVSHQPGDAIKLIDVPNIDKLLHCLVYAVLAYTALFAVSPAIRRSKSKIVGCFVVLFCLLYGISDEFHQYFVPGRFPSKWDVSADTLGAVLAVVSWFKYVEPRLQTANRQL